MPNGLFTLGGSVSGDSELSAGLLTLERSMQDWRGALVPAGEEVARLVDRQFEEEGYPNRWTPLSRATWERTPTRLGGALEDAGRLRRAVTDTGEGAEGSAYRLESQSVTVGELGLPGVEALIWGSAKDNLPARDFLQVTDEYIINIANYFSDHLEALVEDSFGMLRNGSVKAINDAG